MLRRTKADPVIAKQLQLPPVQHITIPIKLNEAERAAYRFRVRVRVRARARVRVRARARIRVMMRGVELDTDQIE